MAYFHAQYQEHTVTLLTAAPTPVRCSSVSVLAPRFPVHRRYLLRTLRGIRSAGLEEALLVSIEASDVVVGGDLVLRGGQAGVRVGQLSACSPELASLSQEWPTAESQVRLSKHALSRVLLVSYISQSTATVEAAILGWYSRPRGPKPVHSASASATPRIASHEWIPRMDPKMDPKNGSR